MARYELTENQVVSMIQIIDNTNFKGADCQSVISLKQSLSAPIPEPTPEPKKEEEKEK